MASGGSWGDVTVLKGLVWGRTLEMLIKFGLAEKNSPLLLILHGLDATEPSPQAFSNYPFLIYLLNSSSTYSLSVQFST